VTRQPSLRDGRAEPRHVDVLRDEELLALFADLGPSLVITGRPGSGKSTLAAALGLALARRARDDREAPVPVLVELNRLGERELSALIEATLTNEHYVPPHLAGDWVAGAAVLPILDGLDESSLPIDKVIEKIERVRRDGAQSVIVCCRSDVYNGASRSLSGAVGAEISDLEPDRLTRFLREIGWDRKSASALAERLADLPELQTVLGLKIAASDPTRKGSVCSLLSEYVRHLVAERTECDPQEVEQFLAGVARVMTAGELVPDALRLFHVRPSEAVDRVAWAAAVVHGASFAMLGFGLGRIVDRPFAAWLMAAVFAVVGALTGAVLWDLYDGHRRTSAFVQSTANSLEDDGLGADTVLGNALLFFAFGVVLLPVGALLGFVIGLLAGTGPLWLVVVECTVALWVAHGAAFSLGHATCVIFERMRWSIAPYLGGTRSLRSILVSGLVVAVVLWLLVGPWGLGRILPARAESWITAGVLLTGLVLLIDLIGQNLLARAALARRDQVPFRLWRFLDAMVVAGVMRPVPRGAAFFHRLYYECLTNGERKDADRSS
jgi:NACHT domain